jgi:hypothetical protein
MEEKKKRRSRINRDEYPYLFPPNIEQIAADYDEVALRNIAGEVHGFYMERIIRFDITPQKFTDLFLSYSRGYRADDEINFYYYIKVSIEKHLNLFNYKFYFNVREEDALRLYITETNERRKEKLYNKFLKYAFDKLVENLINTYELRSTNVSYQDLHTSVVSLVHEKLSNFKPSKNKKAYSYFGTIIKRHLINERKLEQKSTKRNDSYDVLMPHICDSIQHSYLEKVVEQDNINVKFFYDLIDMLREYLVIGSPDIELTANDIAVGTALLQLFENCHNIFADEYGQGTTNRYKKNLVLNMIKSYTGLNSSSINISMRIFRERYKVWKLAYIEPEYNPFDDFN